MHSQKSVWVWIVLQFIHFCRCPHGNVTRARKWDPDGETRAMCACAPASQTDAASRTNAGSLLTSSPPWLRPQRGSKHLPRWPLAGCHHSAEKGRKEGAPGSDRLAHHQVPWRGGQGPFHATPRAGALHPPFLPRGPRHALPIVPYFVPTVVLIPPGAMGVSRSDPTLQGSGGH